MFRILLVAMVLLSSGLSMLSANNINGDWNSVSFYESSNCGKTGDFDYDKIKLKIEYPFVVINDLMNKKSYKYKIIDEKKTLYSKINKVEDPRMVWGSCGGDLKIPFYENYTSYQLKTMSNNEKKYIIMVKSCNEINKCNLALGLWNNIDFDLNESYDDKKEKLPYLMMDGYLFNKISSESKKKDLVTSGENILLETSHIIEQDKLILTVKSKNLVENGKGGISISFPQFSDTKRVIKKEKIGFDDVALYKKGKKIWNREIRKTVKNPYLLTEGWSNKWRAGEEKIIKLTIDTKNLDNLEVHVRSNVINGKKEYVNPTNSTFYNKQGYYDKILDLSLR